MTASLPPLARAGRAVASALAEAGVAVGGVDVRRGPRLASVDVTLTHAADIDPCLRMGRAFAHALDVRGVRVTPTRWGVAVEVELPRPLWEPLTVGRLGGCSTGMRTGIGVDARGSGIYLYLDNPATPHLFVVGATGSGKTTALQAIVWRLVADNCQWPESLALVLIDGLASGLAPFADVPHLALPLAATPAAGALAIAAVCAELDARIADPLRRTPLVVVVDELAQVTNGNDAAGAGLARIAATGRGLGCHLIAATQHATTAVVNRLVSVNITTRLVGKVADAAASRLAMGSDRDDARTLAGAGDMLLCRGDDVRRVQVPVVTEAEWAMLPSGEPATPISLQKTAGILTTVPHAGHTPRSTTPDEVRRVAGWWQDGRPPGIGRVKREVGCGDGHATRLIAEAKAWRERGGVLASCHPADALMRAHAGATTDGG